MKLSAVTEYRRVGFRGAPFTWTEVILEPLGAVGSKTTANPETCKKRPDAWGRRLTLFSSAAFKVAPVTVKDVREESKGSTSMTRFQVTGPAGMLLRIIPEFTKPSSVPVWGRPGSPSKVTRFAFLGRMCRVFPLNPV